MVNGVSGAAVNAVTRQGRVAMTFTARDAWGDPVVGQTVRLSVSDDDGSQGTINGGEVFTGTTDVNGQIVATFSKTDDAEGQVVVRAELLVPDGAKMRIAHEANVLLTLSEIQPTPTATPGPGASPTPVPIPTTTPRPTPQPTPLPSPGPIDGGTRTYLPVVAKQNM